ncbi:MAG: hypothetical protein ACOC4L_04730 [Halanaerobium sp.]
MIVVVLAPVCSGRAKTIMGPAGIDNGREIIIYTGRCNLDLL